MGFEQDNIYPMLEPSPELVDFSGGFKFTESLFDIALNQSPDCLNVYWREGALWQMDGSEKLTETQIASAPTIRGLFQYGQESSGTKFIIAATGDKVWDYAADVYTDKTGAVVLGDPTAQHFGLTFNDVFIGVTSNRDTPYKKDGAADIVALGGSPPQGKVLGKIGEFIVIGNTAASPSLAYYSDPGNAEGDWTKFWDVGSNDTQGLTAVGSLDQRSGFLFKEKSADRIEMIGGLSFQHDKQYLSVGVVAQGTLQKCSILKDQQAIDVLIGLGENGIHAFDGSKNPFRISDSIAYKFDRNKTDSWNREHLSKAVAKYEPARNWYWLWVPSKASAGVLDELWVCDLNTFAWWPCDPNNSASIELIDDDNGYQQIHVGGTDGYIRKFSNDVRNYDGVAINAYFCTKAIDFKKFVRLRQFIPYAKNSGDWNLDFELRWDLEIAATATDDLLLSDGGSVYGSGTYGSATYGSSRPVFKNLDALNFTGRYLQIKFGNSRIDENFNLYKIEMPARVIGGMVGAYR